MISPDERIKELKKQGYISGVMAGQAKAAFADIMGERFIDVKVERLPWADKYWENGKVPDEAFLAHGWSVSCYNCGKMVDIDTVVLIDTRGALCKECAGKDGK